MANKIIPVLGSTPIEVLVTSSKSASVSISSGGPQGIKGDTGVGSATAPIILNEQTLNYQLVLNDGFKMIDMNVNTENNLIVPPESSVNFVVGTKIIIRQKGTGQTTIVEGSGVTINSQGEKLKLNGKYAMATLIKIASDVWALDGNLTT